MIRPVFRWFFCLVLVAVVSESFPLAAQPFHLPTANRALYEPGGGEKFLVGTVGRTWTSGMFGCVRSEGQQIHEGLDIRCLQRDQRGEPTDPVMATADGTVAYINAKPSLSNYGNYIVLRHRISGVEVYSTYAHLSEVRPGLRVGQIVRTGETIATMGRTANTRETISKERAHVHFEITLLLNERFPDWYKNATPGSRNYHGIWNGQNLIGLDPLRIFQEQQRVGDKFDLFGYIRTQPELCRVFVRETDFPWLHRYRGLIHPNLRARKEGVVGYEIALNFNGVPIELIPRAAGEIAGKDRIQLLSVNVSEQQRNPCRGLVTKRGQNWQLTNRGLNLLKLLTY